MKIRILMLCSMALVGCGSKKVIADTDTKIQSETAYLNESIKVEAVEAATVSATLENVSINEEIIETTYDEKGNVSKKTETKRTIVQDSNQVVTEEKKEDVSCWIRDVQEKDYIRNQTNKSVEQKEDGVSLLWKIAGLIAGLFVALSAIVAVVKYLLTRDDNV